MHLPPGLGVGLILFGLLAIGGTLDGARRKVAQQPDWVGLNWKSYVRGLIVWLVIGAGALVIGIIAVVL